jgi:hypothetical protein
MTVNPGDTLAARCAMVNNLDYTVYTGPRYRDETSIETLRTKLLAGHFGIGLLLVNRYFGMGMTYPTPLV